ncbi:MAG: FAD-dependent oxidoreductase [Vicinamibacterales bacterium]
MQRTDVANPAYYHKVVDCQWACPAHTNVPEYIRLIAQGRFTDAYVLNRESNVFPGILGRTCDRPCEPACRRTRVDGKAVAICRLKRVAADHKDDVRDRLPVAPAEKNGKRIALVGAGPASLTVANDLMPLGYECTIFEKGPRPGGLMRVNIPAFRLPEEVLDEEIGYITGMGVEMRYDTPVESLRTLVDSQEFDAVFVGSGAPKGKELELPGRFDTDQVFIGIEWLESIHFGHVDSVGARVLIIGVGNTAMDCCRSAKRLVATDVKVIARKTRKYFKASPWELEDAEEERVDILENHSPVRLRDRGRPVDGYGVRYVHVPRENGRPGIRSRPAGRSLPATVIPAIGQENAFPWIERDMGLDLTAEHARRRQGDVHVDAAGCVLRRRRRVRTGEHHLGGRARPRGSHLHPQLPPGVPVTERPAQGQTLTSTKMGLHEWAYSNDYSPVARQKMTHVDMPLRFSKMTIEVEQGFTADQAQHEVERCLNCDVQTHFTDSLASSAMPASTFARRLPDHHAQ